VLTGLMAAPVVQIASIGTQISEAFAGLDRIRELLAMATEDEEDSRKAPLGEIDGEIVFEDVTFEYNPGVPVLESVSFHAPAGTTTALVGSSGSGKSTLISLVMAFNRPKTGVVRVDGRDLSTVRLRDYRRHLGVVLQDNFLFDGTIAENIAYARPHADREEIEQVARTIGAHEFIGALPDGYDTDIRSGGHRVSAGQRQLVALARALLADPSVVILDEATPSLDIPSERLVQHAMKTVLHGRTALVIAHRLSTLHIADRVLMMADGRIVEDGTPARVRRNSVTWRAESWF